MYKVRGIFEYSNNLKQQCCGIPYLVQSGWRLHHKGHRRRQGEDITAPKTGTEHVIQELLIYKAYLYPYSMRESEENIKSITPSP